MWRSDVQWDHIRGWMQMGLTPYALLSWNKRNINFNIINEHLITLLKNLLEDAHSVHAGSSSSRLTRPSFFFLLHVASFLAGSWLLDSLLVWGPGPPSPPSPELTHFPQVPGNTPLLGRAHLLYHSWLARAEKMSSLLISLFIDCYLLILLWKQARQEVRQHWFLDR
jgi:hypothetical protein